jgi:hypothetical protein
VIDSAVRSAAVSSAFKTIGGRKAKIRQCKKWTVYVQKHMTCACKCYHQIKSISSEDTVMRKANCVHFKSKLLCYFGTQSEHTMNSLITNHFYKILVILKVVLKVVNSMLPMMRKMVNTTGII